MGRSPLRSPSTRPARSANDRADDDPLRRVGEVGRGRPAVGRVPMIDTNPSSRAAAATTGSRSRNRFEMWTAMTPPGATVRIAVASASTVNRWTGTASDEKASSTSRSNAPGAASLESEPAVARRPRRSTAAESAEEGEARRIAAIATTAGSISKNRYRVGGPPVGGDGARAEADRTDPQRRCARPAATRSPRRGARARW